MRIPILKAPVLEPIPNLCHGFTTRVGGVSEGPYRSLNLGRSTEDEDEIVETNYKHLAEALGVPRNLIAGVQQEHGIDIVRIDSPTSIEGVPSSKADALATAEPGIVLTVRVADCLPILLVDPQHHAAAAIHAGWRGTLAGILPTAIGKMVSWYGSDPSQLWAAVGPGIGLCCFEVSAGISALFEQEARLRSSEKTEPGGKPHLDLKAINIRHAIEHGVRPERVWGASNCTACDAEQFYSYRRDGRKTGRSIGFVFWTA